MDRKRNRPETGAASLERITPVTPKMSFDEEELDPHGECAAEIHRLQAENERLRTALDTLDKNLQLQQWSIRVSLGTLKR